MTPDEMVKEARRQYADRPLSLPIALADALEQSEKSLREADDTNVTLQARNVALEATVAAEREAVQVTRAAMEKALEARDAEIVRLREQMAAEQQAGDEVTDLLTAEEGAHASTKARLAPLDSLSEGEREATMLWLQHATQHSSPRVRRGAAAMLKIVQSGHSTA